MYKRFAVYFLCLFSALIYASAQESEDSPNEPPCEEEEEGAPILGEWTCKTLGTYDGDLEIGEEEIVIALGGSPTDPVTGSSTFTDSTKTRAAGDADLLQE